MVSNWTTLLLNLLSDGASYWLSDNTGTGRYLSVPSWGELLVSCWVVDGGSTLVGRTKGRLVGGGSEHWLWLEVGLVRVELGHWLLYWNSLK